MADNAKSHVKISDGSVWPLPVLSDGERGSVIWRANYTPDSLTRQDYLRLVSIASAYGYLMLETNTKRRNLVVRDIRQAMKDTVSRG
ncbi:hypothetical protein [Mycolicibacterium aubagnense]|uniref:Uncharacterized protein n=1 Tax=Mycolicibacterium aubagnense TaxID=319707 RepID=A0ABN5YMN5_9MYCO|nr:hypothetical protein [Mycolicibacterium aubagnense]TLH64424.1 hypothetical protein C1S80_12115 [Mycolicibacterium aubagnense]BBX82155.1 hypothetical protein MAUB_00280 [Mycolicibacterium aubagnense]